MSQLNQIENENSKFVPWGNVTDPNRYDPNKFRFLVYGVNPIAKATVPQKNILAGLDSSNAFNPDEGDQSIDLLDQPERLTQRVALACSLIDQDHRATWGKIGLIVEAPPQNIRITSTSDAGTSTGSKKLLNEQAAHTQLLSADEILSKTGPTGYNEVVTLADDNGQQVRLAGFFVKVTAIGVPFQEDLARTIQSHAQRLKLPVVKIPTPNPYKEEKIISTSRNLALTLNDRLYSLREGGNYVFRITDQQGITTFPSPQDIELIVQKLSATGLSDGELDQLRKGYKAADENRHRPKVKVSREGQLQSIEANIGYDLGERIIRIYPSGYANEISLVAESRKWLNMNFSASSGNEDSLRYITPNPYTIEQIIQKAIEQASEEQKPLLEDLMRKSRGR